MRLATQNRSLLMRAQVTSFVLHPGSMINTDIGRDGGVAAKVMFTVASPFTKSIGQGVMLASCSLALQVLEVNFDSRSLHNCVLLLEGSSCRLFSVLSRLQRYVKPPFASQRR